MTQIEILQEFKQMPIRQQLATLKAALDIIDANFNESQKNNIMELPLKDGTIDEDPLLSLAGLFHAPMTDISEKHDYYLGQNIQDNHG